MVQLFSGFNLEAKLNKSETISNIYKPRPWKQKFQRCFSTERKANFNSFVFETFALRILKES